VQAADEYGVTPSIIEAHSGSRSALRLTMARAAVADRVILNSQNEA